MNNHSEIRTPEGGIDYIKLVKNNYVPLVDKNTARDTAGISYKIVRVEAAIDIHDESLLLELDCLGVGMGITKGRTTLMPILAWLDDYGNIYTDEDLTEEFGFGLTDYITTDIVDKKKDTYE